MLDYDTNQEIQPISEVDSLYTEDELDILREAELAEIKNLYYCS